MSAELIEVDPLWPEWKIAEADLINQAILMQRHAVETALANGQERGAPSPVSEFAKNQAAARKAFEESEAIKAAAAAEAAEEADAESTETGLQGRSQRALGEDAMLKQRSNQSTDDSNSGQY